MNQDTTAKAASERAEIERWEAEGGRALDVAEAVQALLEQDGIEILIGRPGDDVPDG